MSCSSQLLHLQQLDLDLDDKSTAPTPLLQTLQLPTKIYSLSYAPTTKTLIVSMANRKIYVYDIDDLSKPDPVPKQQRESALKFMTRSVAVMADGQGESRMPFGLFRSIRSRERGTCCMLTEWSFVFGGHVDRLGIRLDRRQDRGRVL